MSGYGLLAGLWAASLSGAVMILAALLLRTTFQNRTPRRVFCLLWDVTLARLLILTALPSPVSVWRWLPPRTARVGYAVIPGLNVPIAETVMGDAATMPGTAPVSPPDTGTILAAVWLMIGLALAAWFLLGHLRFRLTCAGSLPCGDAFVLDRLARRRLRRPVQARTSDRIAAPLTYGLLRPVILLPSGMKWTDRAALCFVLEHEVQHIRRFDSLRKALLAAALCLHWFNPLVWVLYVLSNRDMELACDEAVIAGSADRAGYARTLLNMEEQRGRWGLSGSHFSQNALEERIRCIMKHKKTSVAALAAVLAIMGIAIAVFASNPTAGKAEILQDDPPPDFYRDSAVEVMLSKDRKDGEVRLSVDRGKTWLSEADYLAQYGDTGGPWQVEWWTAGDYAAWLEEEKKALQDMIGERCYTGSEGWFIWDQQHTDEAIALYEEILEDIKNGAQYSKTITEKNGSAVEDVALGSGTPGGTEFFTFDEKDPAPPVDKITGPKVEGFISKVIVHPASADTDGQDTGALLKKYEPFGLRYEIYDVPGASGSLRMSWNGKPVHSLWDTESGTWFANNMHGTELGEGAVDLETVYRDGELCGLRETQPPHEAAHGVVITPVSVS